MRLTYVIRQINFWFARVVYERDSWDINLEQTARSTDLRLGIVLHAARGCVWVTRRILWALMQAGHAISCFMLRQMEYDADSYEAKLAGSDAFEATATRLRVLNAATQVAYEDVRQSWASSRLPENLPLLINHKAASLPSEIHQKLSSSKAAEKTGWFHTHPCDADRIREVSRLEERGVFLLTDPAARLFSDFGELSKTVTRHHYEKNLELEFTEQNLMSAEEVLRESIASAEADAMIRKYCGGVNVGLMRLLTGGALPEIKNREEALARWRDAKQSSESLRAAAEGVSRECVEQEKRLPGFVSAQLLAKAGFKLEPKEFGLPEGVLSPDEQERAAGLAMDETSAAISEQLAELEPFMAALRERVTLALGLAQGLDGAPSSEQSGAVVELARTLAAVAAEMPRAREIGVKVSALLPLAQNRGNHSNPATVETVMSELAAELQALMDGIQERLRGFNYPFPHARGQLSLADYVRYEKPTENEFQRAYVDANAHVDRLFALHYRLVGRILSLANAAEALLDRLASTAC